MERLTLDFAQRQKSADMMRFEHRQNVENNPANFQKTITAELYNLS